MSNQPKKKWNQSSRTQHQSFTTESEPMLPLSALHQVVELLNEFVSQVEEILLHYEQEDTEGMEEGYEDTPSES